MLPVIPFAGILAGAAGKTLLQKILEIIATEGTKIVVKESCKKIFSNNSSKSRSTDKHLKSNKNKERHKIDHINSSIKHAPIKSQNSKKKNSKNKKDSEKYKVNI